MAITGIAATSSGGQDLYQGLVNKNTGEEFSLDKQTSKSNEAKNPKQINALASVDESKKNFWDNFSLQVSKNTNPAQEQKSYEERFADIKRKGDIAMQHPLPGVVKDYVSDLRNFLNDVRDNAFTGQSKDGIFEKLDLADEKLQKLADQLLAEEKPKLDLVASLGELQGLLVDIFV